MDLIINIAVFLIAAIIFTFVGMFLRKKTAESKMKSAESEAQRIIEMANKDAENRKKEEIFKAKEEIMNARKDLDAEIRERRGEVQVQEKRIMQKEENLEKKMDSLEKREKDLIDSTLYLVGKEAIDNSYVKNANPCILCKRFILNAGIKEVIIRKDKNNYEVIDTKTNQ